MSNVIDIKAATGQNRFNEKEVDKHFVTVDNETSMEHIKDVTWAKDFALEHDLTKPLHSNIIEELQHARFMMCRVARDGNDTNIRSFALASLTEAFGDSTRTLNDETEIGPWDLDTMFEWGVFRDQLYKHPVLVHDRDIMPIQVNPATLRVLKIKKQDIIGTPPEARHGEIEAGKLRAAFQLAVEKFEVEYDHTWRCGDFQHTHLYARTQFWQISGHQFFVTECKILGISDRAEAPIGGSEYSQFIKAYDAMFPSEH